MKKIKVKKTVGEQKKNQYELLNSKLGDFWNKFQNNGVLGEIGRMCILIV